MRARRRALVVACFLAPSLLIFVVYRILPLVWNVVLSFQFWSPLHPAAWAGWDNYDEMLHDERHAWLRVTPRKMNSWDFRKLPA